MKVKFSAEQIDPATLKTALESKVGDAANVSLEVEQSDVRAVETAIVVAVITAVAGVLKTLITSALEVAKERQARKVILQSDLGRIEVPANLPPEQIDQLMDRVTPIASSELNIHLD